MAREITPSTDAEIISGLNEQITSAKERASFIEGVLGITRQQLANVMSENAELAFINSQFRKGDTP